MLNLSLGIFFLILFIIYGSNNKKEEMWHKTIEKIIINYLNMNSGKAYTTKALLNNLEENIKNPNFRKYLLRNGEEILNKMILDENIQMTQKDEQIHYFLKST